MRKRERGCGLQYLLPSWRGTVQSFLPHLGALYPILPPQTPQHRDVHCFSCVSPSKLPHQSTPASYCPPGPRPGLVIPEMGSSSTSSDPDFSDLSGVPPCYLDLKEVFNKARATSLPPHCPYDCALDLLPSTALPRGQLYFLFAPEKEAMEKYVSSSLAAAIIHPSSSPAGTHF